MDVSLSGGSSLIVEPDEDIDRIDHRTEPLKEDFLNFTLMLSLNKLNYFIRECSTQLQFSWNF